MAGIQLSPSPNLSDDNLPLISTSHHNNNSNSSSRKMTGFSFRSGTGEDDGSGSGNGRRGRKWWKGRVMSRRMKLVLSYAPDWIITLVVGGLFFVIGNLSGFKREFSLTDTSIQHTFAQKERISDTNLFLIAVVAPLVLMPLINLATIRSFWDWHNAWLGVVCSCSFAGTFTNIVKATVGRPRPDLIDRCQPIPGSADHPIFGLVNVSICTQSDKGIIDDGFKSFWSGHSSLSFAGLGFLSFYLAGKLHLFDKRGHAGKAWISMVPLAGAGLVAISRTMDYRHHWHDVLVGSFVGIVFAYFAYRQYYPSLQDVRSHMPYTPRIDRSLTKGRQSESILPQHSAGGHDVDEEAAERDRTYERHDPAALDDYNKVDGAASGEGGSGVVGR